MDTLWQNQALYSPTILKKVLSLVPQFRPYLETFESYTTADWLNRMFIQSKVVLLSNVQTPGEKDKKKTKNAFLEWVVNTDPVCKKENK